MADSEVLSVPVGGPASPDALSSAMSTELLHLEVTLIDPDPPALDPQQATPFASAPASQRPDNDLQPRLAQTDASITEQYSSLFLPCVKRSGVDVYAWGRGDSGQLGDGSRTDTALPRLVGALEGKDIVCVAAGAFHTAAVTADGELYAWGSNEEGQCGVRGPELAASPARVGAVENFNIRLAACGASHTLAVAEDGGVFACGSSDFGQLGIGAAAARVQHPRLVKALKEPRTARVAAGGRHTLALGSGGDVHAFGDGSSGALGLGGSDSCDTPRPLLRLWPLGVAQIAAGEAHSAALTVTGAVLTWGRGKSGQLGHGGFQSCLQPKVVEALPGPAHQIACGGDHTTALTADGQVYAFGQGKWGQTGQGHTENVCLPCPVVGVGERVVQASAGGRHTLLLSASGEVFACGYNDNGQAGAPLAGSVLAPRRVEGLPKGSTVLYIVAGGDHSATVLQRGTAWAARPTVERPQGERWLPLTVPPLLPLVAAAAEGGSPDAGKLRAVVNAVERAFANPAFLLQAMSVGGGRAAVGSDSSRQPPAAGPMDTDVSGGGADAGEDADEVQTGAVDSSGMGSAAVAERSPEPLPECSQRIVQEGGQELDIPFIGQFYQSLLKLYSAEVAAALGGACVRLLDATERYMHAFHAADPVKRPKSRAQLDCMLLPELAWVAPTLFIVLQNPLTGDNSYGRHIVLRVGRILSATLPAEQRIPVRRALQALLALLPADAFAARCVRPVQRYLDYLVGAGRLGTSRLEVMMTGVLLDVLRQANEGAGDKIPYSEFYNQALSSAVDLQAEYLAWVRHRETAPHALVSLCQMPFLLTPEAKANVLHGEAMMQKQQNMNAAALQAFFQGRSPEEAGFLRLAVRRTHIVEDALNGLVVHSEDLKKPLKVTFVSGGLEEPAQDEGGVRKEFFQLLCRDLFRPEFGMFEYNEATRTYWFSASSLEADVEYELVGAAFGLAIYNAVLLDAHFPLVVYKKLLGGRPTFADLKDASPELGRGLQALLDYEPAADVEAVFCHSFVVEYEFFGERRTQELMPGGAGTPVTGGNRLAYVGAYTKWVLDDSVARQFAAFARGFLRVCGGPALTLFTPAELELLVCGLPHLDFDGLKRAAKYDGGYTPGSQPILWFWDIVLNQMTLDQKRQLLAFSTGSDRAPVGGLSKLPILLQRAGPDTDRLPTSHTCFNTLLLPEYSSKEKMRERLLTAVGNARGFGLR